MNYHVEWLPDAVEGLQRVFHASTDQQGLINTVTRIGLELGARPGGAGESRDKGMRILFKYPLIVWFRIDERLKVVSIYEVRGMRKQ